MGDRDEEGRGEREEEDKEGGGGGGGVSGQWSTKCQVDSRQSVKVGKQGCSVRKGAKEGVGGGIEEECVIQGWAKEWSLGLEIFCLV